MKDRKAFMGKTLRLSGHLYLEKAVEYARRDEFQELIFIIYILGFVLASFVQMFLCYVKAADVEKNAIIVHSYYFYCLNFLFEFFYQSYLIFLLHMRTSVYS